MPVRKNSFSLLVILLIILFSNEKAVTNYGITGLSSSFSKQINLGSSFGNVKEIIKSPFVFRDKIRVRYMGGECRYDAPGFHLLPVLPVFSTQLTGGKYISFTASQPHFLFKLRGPPAMMA